MINTLGIELEKQIIDKFTNAGWTVKEVGRTSNIPADFEIFDDDQVSYGYVDVKYNLRPDLMMKQIERWRYIIKELKPKLFIITDGVQYHISTYGGDFEVIHFVPRPKTYYALKGLIEEFADYVNKKGGNK